jgi:D-alanyl-D-alanine carboxypeptidase (penicillin-binding protein 5/6)
MRRLALVCSLFCLAAGVLWGAPAGQSLAIAAKAAIVLDRETGEVLWAHNAERSFPMASTTKIMTAIVILDHGADRLDETVTVSPVAFAAGGSSQFAAGDTVLLGDLLKAALIRSSNEATVAAAEYLAGSEAAFVGWMNDKAQQMGLRHTHFVNPHGLYDPHQGARHYSSAHDLALITREALQRYPLIRQIVTQGRPRPVIVKALPRGDVWLENRNKILNQPVPGIPGSRVDGVKTGYVKEAGKCLVSSATLNGWQLIAVVLNSPDMFAESQTLLHYGFSRYHWRTYAEAGQLTTALDVRGGARKVPVAAATRLGAPELRLEYGEETEAQVRVVPLGPAPPARGLWARARASGLAAPIPRGAHVGTLRLERDGRVLCEVPAVAMDAVPLAWWVVWGRGVGWTLLGLVALAVLERIYATVTKTHRRSRRRVASSG